MWIFLRDSMLSIVQDYRDDDTLLVRARLPGDIERVFNDDEFKADVIENAGSDYRYRAFISRSRVMNTIAAEVEAITYSNFKAAVHELDETRAGYYSEVWGVMFDYQNDFQIAQEEKKNVEKSDRAMEKWFNSKEKF